MSIKATPEIDTSPQMFILGMSERCGISRSKGYHSSLHLWDNLKPRLIA